MQHPFYRSACASSARDARGAAGTLPATFFSPRRTWSALAQAMGISKVEFLTRVLPDVDLGVTRRAQPQGKAEPRLHFVGKRRMLASTRRGRCSAGAFRSGARASPRARNGRTTRGIVPAWGRGPFTRGKRSRAGSHGARRKASSKPEGQGRIMKVKFWGVRGSCRPRFRPTRCAARSPLWSSGSVPSDLENSSPRALPRRAAPVTSSARSAAIRRAWRCAPTTATSSSSTAARAFATSGVSLEKKRDPTREFPIFFTHFHWDHLQGIPFFGPAWVKGNRSFSPAPFRPWNAPSGTR